MDVESSLATSMETSGGSERNHTPDGTSSCTSPRASSLAMVRTRSEYEKLVKNSIDSIKVKEELLDYEDDDPRYYDYHSDVFCDGAHTVASASAAATASNSFSNVSSSAPSIEAPTNSIESAPLGSRAYLAVRAARRAASSLRQLNSAPVAQEKTGSGSFMHLGDERHIRTGIGSDLGTRINWTSSFGRPAGICHTCLGGRHEALRAGGGGAGGHFGC